ncbi:MAG TPA: hypothetical protein PLD20_27885 [Blastocatellia bacterium]|nr:hypothetical protein [Blastocatellia bacterium]HMX28812.1 hypothetical protein [Blastocatellia bacterium]HMY72352.1 hypothetical protein [Blastocatellia bacterium]HMZ21784.1 hypothetical protein [Blastocatellia bacterium]HNG34108.1 hypothetical protein [Blastocatellia bacterium]
MRQLLLAAVLLFALAGVGIAQTDSTQSLSASSVLPVTQSGKERKALGYVFFGPGAVLPGESSTFLNFGGGGEGFVKGGLSVGAEIGGYVPAKQFDEGIGILNAGVGYHFLKASKSGKVVPFVNGGYSLLFRSGAENGVHFGGGLHYWFKDRVGLRFEVRDQVAVSYNAHFVGFRFGLSFR